MVLDGFGRVWKGLGRFGRVCEGSGGSGTCADLHMCGLAPVRTAATTTTTSASDLIPRRGPRGGTRVSFMSVVACAILPQLSDVDVDVRITSF